MNLHHAQNILFDDFTLLEQHIGRPHLIATSVNANCDCASSPVLNSNCDCAGYPSTSRYDDRNPDQIAPSVGQAD